MQFRNVTKAGLKQGPRFKKYENAFHLLKWKAPGTPSDEAT
jgi:hypothetical protein